ncbi:DUF4861 family protein [Autumnicola psychrophila]|uniref:DUF4861 family protein n=1 Tax=Autumnicola psychrophila TaxID=3075592 RepID=A0ABU3DLZ1_9FLAO|nr:DUF4861 family protein [Zunongwangia sp. F225]MDT0684740.1 DUF4861 family protein [Zunongwangia sp. F225]
MNKYFKFLIIATVMVSLAGCNQESENKALNIEVSNDLDFPRNEVVSIDYEKLENFLKGRSMDNLRIRKRDAEQYIRSQWIDYDQDGNPDELLFPAEVEASSMAEYEVVLDSAKSAPESDVIAYSRFVPERTDDYTWENDKVAFRTYGPTGQKEALEGVPGSTLSSGIDLWLKRTEKAIIDKWYAEHLKNPGYYHIDHGEGYDPYHVGGSRGTGGSGVWEDDSLYVSQNYTDYRTIADGPLRTVFELDYAEWSPYNVTETKRITLDLGTNFSKFEVDLSAEDSLPNYAVGITLHENEGKYELNPEEGWVVHWEVIDSSYVGQALVLNPKIIDSSFAAVSKVQDQSNLLILTQPRDKITYYAGFGWEKSDQIKTLENWQELVKKQSRIISSPLEVVITE